MKVATWNINSVKSRIPNFLEFVGDTDPDIILLQELKCETEKFPHDELSHLPYNFYVHGQKSYNGVAILSKFPADEILYNFEGNPCSEQARFIEARIQTPLGFYRIISLYAPNGGEVGSEKFELKLKFYDSLTKYFEESKRFNEKLLIGGDFNIAPFNIDVYSPIALANSTCFTLIERQKLRTFLNSTSFEDMYRLIHPEVCEFSWWDYRAGSFEHNRGIRIDMILASSSSVGDFKHCYMDYKIRAQSKPSDHIPVLIY